MTSETAAPVRSEGASGPPDSPGSKPKKRRIPGWVWHPAAIVASLLPLAYCLLRGSMGASLWLDEILYYHFERHPEVRAIEMGRPGSLWARLVGTYGYCDLQRAVHALFDATGFHLAANPELYLRLPSTVYLVLAVVALYVIGLRAFGDRLWAFGVALAFGSTPAFLFYSFEARVYSLAGLLVIAFLVSLSSVLEGARGWGVAAAAFLGTVAVWAHLWNVCLLAGVGLCLPFILWRDPEHWRKAGRVTVAIGFGAAFAVAQALYVFSLRVPGQHGIPLFEPQPLKSLLYSTAYGPFLGLLRGDPEYVLGILLAISLFRVRGKLGWCLPAAVWLALALSILLMSRFGFGISPRHQTALYAGIFACLALTRSGFVSKALLANLIGLNLVLLPATAERIEAKGNAKQIAQVIATGQLLRRTPVVVQHSYNLGYPDPLHSFALAFYLDGLRRDEAVTPILELPTHRDVRGVLLDRDYFANGEKRLAVFTRAPIEEWKETLARWPSRFLWFVAPSGGLDIKQARVYEAALKASGFARVRGVQEQFTGYPTTRLMLWARREPGR